MLIKKKTSRLSIVRGASILEHIKVAHALLRAASRLSSTRFTSSPPTPSPAPPRTPAKPNAPPHATAPPQKTGRYKRKPYPAQPSTSAPHPTPPPPTSTGTRAPRSSPAPRKSPRESARSRPRAPGLEPSQPHAAKCAAKPPPVPSKLRQQERFRTPPARACRPTEIGAASSVTMLPSDLWENSSRCGRMPRRLPARKAQPAA